MNGLNHNALTCSAVPIPPWERSLQTVEAQPYFNVSQASLVLEGIVFDRNNNLLFVDVATGRVFKLTPEQQLSIIEWCYEFFSQADNILIRQPRPKVGIAFADNIECVPGKTIRQLVIAGLSTTAVRHTPWA